MADFRVLVREVTLREYRVEADDAAEAQRMVEESDALPVEEGHATDNGRIMLLGGFSGSGGSWAVEGVWPLPE